MNGLENNLITSFYPILKNNAQAYDRYLGFIIQSGYGPKSYSDLDYTSIVNSNLFMTLGMVNAWFSSTVPIGDFAQLPASQTFTGVNTFTLSPTVPNPTTGLQAVNFQTLQASIPAPITNYVATIDNTIRTATSSATITVDETTPGQIKWNATGTTIANYLVSINGTVLNLVGGPNISYTVDDSETQQLTNIVNLTTSDIETQGNVAVFGRTQTEINDGTLRGLNNLANELDTEVRWNNTGVELYSVNEDINTPAGFRSAYQIDTNDFITFYTTDGIFPSTTDWYINSVNTTISGIPGSSTSSYIFTDLANIGLAFRPMINVPQLTFQSQNSGTLFLSTHFSSPFQYPNLFGFNNQANTGQWILTLDPTDCNKFSFTTLAHPGRWVASYADSSASTTTGNPKVPFATNDPTKKGYFGVYNRTKAQKAINKNTNIVLSQPYTDFKSLQITVGGLSVIVNTAGIVVGGTYASDALQAEFDIISTTNFKMNYGNCNQVTILGYTVDFTVKEVINKSLTTNVDDFQNTTTGQSQLVAIAPLVLNTTTNPNKSTLSLSTEYYTKAEIDALLLNYVKTDGTQPFLAPQSGVNGAAATDLVTLQQVQSLITNSAIPSLIVPRFTLPDTNNFYRVVNIAGTEGGCLLYVISMKNASGSGAQTTMIWQTRSYSNGFGYLLTFARPADGSTMSIGLDAGYLAIKALRILGDGAQIDIQIYNFGSGSLPTLSIVTPPTVISPTVPIDLSTGLQVQVSNLNATNSIITKTLTTPVNTDLAITTNTNTNKVNFGRDITTQNISNSTIISTDEIQANTYNSPTPLKE